MDPFFFADPGHESLSLGTEQEIKKNKIWLIQESLSYNGAQVEGRPLRVDVAEGRKNDR